MTEFDNDTFYGETREFKLRAAPGKESVIGVLATNI